MRTIAAVPESITRHQYLDLIASVGFDVTDLRRLEFRTDGIYAEVFYRNEHGRQIIDPARNELVVDKVYIPVRD